MAETTEQITILKLRTEGAESVKDLKQNIKDLKQVVSETKIGTEDYQKALDLLKVNQNALKDAMYATTASLEEVKKSATGTGESYNALVHRMASLKEELRNTDRSTDDGKKRFAELAFQVNEVNAKLKEMDRMQGNYQRNVGNYASALQGLGKSFSGVGISAGGLVRPLAAVTGGLQAMSATPVVSIMGLLANVLTEVFNAMKRSEGATAALRTAFSGFAAVGEAVSQVLAEVGKGVAWLINGFSDLASAVFGVSDKMKERQALVEKDLELQKRERETTRENADAEREIAQLREKASDKLTYTAKERLEFQRKAGDLENDIAKRAYEDLKTQYEIIKAKNALSNSTTEELRKEADAYAAMVKAETDYFNRKATNNKALTRLTREEGKIARDAAKERMDALKAQISAEKDLIQQEIDLTQQGTEQELALRKAKRAKEYELAMEEAKTKVKNQKDLQKTLLLLEKKYNRDILSLERDHQKSVEAQENLHLQNVANTYAQGTAEYLSAMRDLRRQQLEQIRQEEGETEEEYNARRLAAQKAYLDSIRALNARHLQDSTAELRLALAEQMGQTEAYYAGQVQLAESAYDKLQRLEGENDTEFAIRKAEHYAKLKEAQQEYLNYMDSQEKLSLSNRMNTYMEGSAEYLSAAIDLKRWELEQVLSIGQLETETEEDFLARKLEAEKNYTNAKRDLISQQIAMMQSVAKATSTILGAIADMYDSDEANSERNANRIKGLKIASATIDTISGAIGAYMQSVSTIPPPAGAITGAIQAAAVTATGMAQIAQIKKTKVTGSASANPTPAIVSAPTITPQVANVRNVTSASEEERLNRMSKDQRVYILASDIEASQNHIRTQVAESSF